MTYPENYDSPEEEAFFFWCVEAQKAGVIESFEYQPESIEIIPAKHYIEHKQLKTKVKEIERTLFQPMSYTADFKIIGNMYQFHKPKSHMLNIYAKDQSNSEVMIPFYIDVKGTFKGGSKGKNFNMIQKVIYHCNGIYVNRVIPAEFFNIAWVPMPYESVYDNNHCWTDERNFSKKGFVPARKRKAFEKALTIKEWEDKKWSF